MFSMLDAVHPFWPFITRFGEAQILLPMALGLSALMWRRGVPPRFVLGWLGWTGLVAAITTVSKLAFIGWGVGSARLDFTGISGHAMFAAAIYPVLFRLLPRSQTRHAALWRALGVSGGLMLALLVAISRVMVNAHSVSEVVIGHLLGLAASALSLRLVTQSRLGPLQMPRWVPAAVAAWLLVLPYSAPASVTHDLVTRLALSLSGRDTPYRRSDLLRHRDRPAAHAPLDAATAAPRSPAPRSDNSAALRGGSRHS